MCCAVLRGVATLGIQSFSMISSAYFNPTAYGNFENANYWVWHLSHLLADMKFMSIFSILFGAGTVLMSDRRTARGLPATGFHYRRMGWLLVIGLLHAHLLWQGDILVTYALCGSAVFWFRNLSPRVLWVTGLLCFSVASGVSILTGLSIPFWPQKDVLQMQQEVWQPGEAEIQKEIATYLQPWIQQLPMRSKEGFFSRDFCVPVFVCLAMLRPDVDRHGVVQTGSPLISLGYVGAIMLICKSDVWSR